MAQDVAGRAARVAAPAPAPVSAGGGATRVGGAIPERPLQGVPRGGRLSRVPDVTSVVLAGVALFSGSHLPQRGPVVQAQP
jgi:hypothetical protein